jgi:hypothetical protein
MRKLKVSLDLIILYGSFHVKCADSLSINIKDFGNIILTTFQGLICH